MKIYQIIVYEDMKNETRILTKEGFKYFSFFGKQYLSASEGHYVCTYNQITFYY